MLELFQKKVKKSFELTGILMCGTGALVWFFVAYFICIKAMHDIVRLIQRLF